MCMWDPLATHLLHILQISHVCVFAQHVLHISHMFVFAQHVLHTSHMCEFAPVSSYTYVYTYTHIFMYMRSLLPIHLLHILQPIPLGVTFSKAVSKLKARTSLLTETWQKKRASFELWAFENVTPSGIGCTYISPVCVCTRRGTYIPHFCTRRGTYISHVCVCTRRVIYLSHVCTRRVT